jgi:1,4-alpha-glucan branching enzyme
MSTAGGGYLSFMGNEFGHPEWIDFPRQGNGWSYKYARRQWHLADDPSLRYQYLLDFDREMVHLLGSDKFYQQAYANQIHCDEAAQVLAYERSGYVFVFSFNPIHSFSEYYVPVSPGKYKLILSTDSSIFGGFDRVEEKTYFSTGKDNITAMHANYLNLNLPCQVGLVFEKEKTRSVWDL